MGEEPVHQAPQTPWRRRRLGAQFVQFPQLAVLAFAQQSQLF
jgi:hypothetical protein